MPLSPKLSQAFQAPFLRISLEDSRDVSADRFAVRTNLEISDQVTLAIYPVELDRHKAENRPNEVKVTINGSDQSFLNMLGSTDGADFDAITIGFIIPAGATSLTVEPIPTNSQDPLGASVSWIVGAPSTVIPLPVVVIFVPEILTVSPLYPEVIT